MLSFELKKPLLRTRNPVNLYYMICLQPLSSGVINAPILNIGKIVETLDLVGSLKRIKNNKLLENNERRQLHITRSNKKDGCKEKLLW